MNILFLLLCVGLFTVIQTHAVVAGNRGDKISDLIKSKSLGKTEKTLSPAKDAAGSGAADAIRSHREKKERPHGRALGEIEDELLERKASKGAANSFTFGAARTADRLEFLNKRKPRKIIDKSATDDIAAQGSEESVKKQRRPYTYSISQDEAEIASWKQIKIYIIIGMFACIIAVVGVTYYRGKNKMLLPGKLM
jgi:hypothetical protein